MQGVTVGFLSDLLAATETVGDDEPVGGSVTDSGKQFEFADGARDCVLFFFKTKGAGHAAASGSGRGEIDAHAAENGFLGGHLHDGFVMAMAMDERFAGEFGDGEIFGVLFEKFAEQEDLPGERVGAVVVGKEVGEFVAEDGGAAWLENDDRRALFDLLIEGIHDFEEQGLGAVEEAEVVEWASAAEVRTRNEHVEAGGFEYFSGGAGGGGQEVVVESVGPE